MNLERIEFGSATKVGVLENYQLNWKEREVGKSEVGKSQAQLERTERSWKVRAEFGKLGLKLESKTEVGKLN